MLPEDCSAETMVSENIVTQAFSRSPRYSLMKLPNSASIPIGQSGLYLPRSPGKPAGLVERCRSPGTTHC